MESPYNVVLLAVSCANLTLHYSLYKKKNDKNDKNDKNNKK
jgi:hypothetical protein